MQAETIWQRAVLLYNQRRWELAIRELRGLLALEPDHAYAHALLAYSLIQLDDFDTALASAQRAVGLQPDADFAHGALAVVSWRRLELPAAESAILRAIELNPGEVDHRSTLAQIRVEQRRWKDALAAADAGLAIDAEDTDCLNLRALALSNLGRGDEARESVDASLAHDPDNPYTHQTQGMALLHRGDADGALHHFQAALRRDPTLEGARAGLVEALKARNPLYRSVLRWFLWLDRFAPGRQVQILVLLWLGARFLSGALDRAGYPTLAMLARYSWLGFVLFTSCAVPLFNLLLLLHPIGRHALEIGAKRHAMLLAGCLGIALLVGTHAAMTTAYWSNVGWIFWLLYLLPIAGLGVFHPGWAQRVLASFCGIVAAAWTWWAIRAAMLAGEMAEIVEDGARANPVWNSALHERGIGLVPGGTSEVARAAVETFIAHMRVHNVLLTALVLSTWFMLLAPKGRPRRGKRTSA